MGIGKENSFKSDSIEYETPDEIFLPLKQEFDISLDVAASSKNNKCDEYYTKEMDAFTKDWDKAFWMNPPWGRDLKKWVQRASEQVKIHGVTGVLLLPVRTNTQWWHKYIINENQEVRFLKGEIKFNGMDRGLWLPVAIVVMQ